MYFLKLFWLLIKILLIMAPFVLLGFLIKPFIPNIGLPLAMLIWAVSFAFGFFVMVVSHNDGTDSKKARTFHLVGKIVFLALCSIFMAAMIKLDSSVFLTPPIVILLILSLCLIGVKCISSIDLGYFLSEIFD